MSRSTSDRFPPGARVGDYHIQAELRVEDTGVVYEATHVVLPRRCAIKVMHRDPWLREMAIQVVREACVLEGLDHAGIPRILECGVLSDRTPWFAMERMDGVSVADAVGAASTLSVPEVIYLLRDAGEILASAHKAGVIHRMVTAQNLVRTAGRKFPYALLNWADAYTLEVELDGELPAGLVDERDDVHALGAIAYRALTGELAADHVSCVGRRPSAPYELAELIDEMVHPDREGRPAASSVWARAAAIATAIELIPALSQIDKPRWTPAYGLSPDRIPKKTTPPAIAAAQTVVTARAKPPTPAPVAPVHLPSVIVEDEPAVARTASAELAIRFKPRSS